MINRTMVRTRVIQTLFAYYKDGDKTVTGARKELTKSFADTYDLYFVLLDFVNELTAYAQQQIEEQIGRARATHSGWQPNRRFTQNRFAQQIFDNRALRTRMQEQTFRMGQRYECGSGDIQEDDRKRFLPPVYGCRGMLV